MNRLSDQQLLRDYTERRSETAFAELVRRYVDLVYSAALRMVRDPHLAEDVTQAVFVAFAQKARQLIDRSVLSGWLHRTAQNLAANAVRSDVRRRAREQEAAAMNELLSAGSDSTWENIAPHLDDALGELSEPDRDALLLRYFERKSAQEMAQTLGISDEAAQKRVSRAVERLREVFAKRGLTVGANGLVVVISANVVQAAPVGLAVTISTAAALAGTTLVTTATITKTIAMTTLQKTLIGATLVVAVGTGIYEARQAATLRDQVQVLQRQQAPLAERIEQLSRDRDEGTRRLGVLRDDNARLNRSPDELLRLRGEVNMLRRQQDDLLKQLAVKTTSPPAQQKQFDAAWLEQVLNSPPKDQGAAAGNLRGKLLRREMTNVSPSEVALQNALLERQLNQTLEHSPAEFADFQAAFIQSSLAIADGTRSQQMRDLIQKTYEQAVASGLDIPSKPATDTEAWVQRRFQLDRQATAQLKQLLTPDEQALFDRAFLGVMGIDLGGVGVDKSNYPKGFLGPD